MAPAEHKRLIVVGGPNGAGKTTFAEEYLSRHSCTYLSADSIAGRLSPDRPEAAQFAAGRRFLADLASGLLASRSIVVESTLSGRAWLRSLTTARDAGFATTIVMLFLGSPDTCVARVRERVRKGGHDVPEADIRRRFYRSIRNFWGTYRFLTDDWVLAYNAGSDFQDVAIGAGDAVSVRDEKLFDDFLALTRRASS